MTNECRCGKPTRDGRYACDTCLRHLRTALEDGAFVDQELETSMTKQRAAAPSGGSRSTTRGLPWHDKAAEARRNLHGLLAMWVKFCQEENVPGAVQTPADNVTALSRWLVRCVDGLAMRDIVSEAVDEITDAVADCRRVVFWKRRNRIYLGPCDRLTEPEHTGLTCECHCHDGYGYACSEPGGCGVAFASKGEPCPGDVYADEGEDVGKCEECKEGVTVAVRRRELERQLDDRLCTPAEIARLSTYLGLHVSREQVRRRIHYWHRHKRITPSGHDDSGDPTFRYSDVRALLYREYATREDKGA